MRLTRVVGRAVAAAVLAASVVAGVAGVGMSPDKGSGGFHWGHGDVVGACDTAS
jgi:hypothetical protein